jgi:uncharacterized protein (UPF0548 family)
VTHLTYAEVGATRQEPLPAHYNRLHYRTLVGEGADVFACARDAVLTFRMHRATGARVRVDAARAAPGVRLTIGLGPLAAPCRVVYVIDDADRRGFAYGTLPGHPESGEELFAVRYDPATDEVNAEVVAFSRHATWWSRLGSPVTSLAQRVITTRYLTAL